VADLSAKISPDLRKKKEGEKKKRTKAIIALGGAGKGVDLSEGAALRGGEGGAPPCPSPPRKKDIGMSPSRAKKKNGAAAPGNPSQTLCPSQAPPLEVLKDPAKKKTTRKKRGHAQS